MIFSKFTDVKPSPQSNFRITKGCTAYLQSLCIPYKTPCTWESIFICFYWFAFSWIFHRKESYTLWSFVSGFFQSVGVQGSSKSEHIYVVHFFLLLNNVLFYGYCAFCLSRHQLMYTGIVSTFWLSWRKPQKTFTCKSSCEHTFLFILGKVLRLKLLDLVNLCLNF